MIAGINRADFGEEVAESTHVSLLTYLKRWGNNTEKPYRVDRMMIETTIKPPMRFWTGVLRRSPMVVRSFSSRIKNTRAAGSSVTAITWTNNVINTSGALGIRTTRPAVTSIRK